MASECSETCDATAPADDPTAEFAELLPPDAEFEVHYKSNAGRFMASRVPLPQGSDFLIETPLVAWPLAPELAAAPGGLDGRPPWCEGCLRRLGRGEAAEPPAPSAEGPRRVRRRIGRKQPPRPCDDLADAPPAPGAEPGGMCCPACAERLGPQLRLLGPGLLARWRRWQAARSASSCVGLEAFGRCFAKVASTAADVRETLGVDPMTAVQIAMRPFDRLAEPPPGGAVTLHGTQAAEVAAELRASEPFWSALQVAVGCPTVASALVSESSVDALAGRLVLNAAGIQALGAGPGGTPLRAAGVFVLLSTMNHACAPTAEAVFGASSTVTLRTTCDVATGAALTLAYVPTELPAEERRAKLRHWFFECDCWRCEAEGRVAEALAR